MKLTYNPDVFAVADLESARRMILTPTGKDDTDARWERETPYLTEVLGEMLKPTQGQVILDYGCGIGRLAKTLIARHGCRVLGVDISVQMRGLAPGYVESPGFSVVSRYVLDGLVSRGFRADAAFSVWVLQHCIDPEEDIKLLRAAVKTDAPVAVVNTLGRAVPAVERPWNDDGKDVAELLSAAFEQVSSWSLDREALGERAADGSFAALYRR